MSIHTNTRYARFAAAMAVAAALAACAAEPLDNENVEEQSDALSLAAPGVVVGWDKCCQDANGDGTFDSCGSPYKVLGKLTCGVGWVKANCGRNKPSDCTKE